MSRARQRQSQAQTQAERDAETEGEGETDGGELLEPGERGPGSTVSSRWFGTERDDSFRAPADLLRSGNSTGVSMAMDQNDSRAGTHAGADCDRDRNGDDGDSGTVVRTPLPDGGPRVRLPYFPHDDSAGDNGMVSGSFASAGAHPLLSTAAARCSPADEARADTPASSRWSAILAEEDRRTQLYDTAAAAAAASANAGQAGGAVEEDCYDVPQRAVPRGWLSNSGKATPTAATSMTSPQMARADPSDDGNYSVPQDAVRRR